MGEGGEINYFMYMVQLFCMLIWVIMYFYMVSINNEVLVYFRWFVSIFRVFSYIYFESYIRFYCSFENWLRG